MSTQNFAGREPVSFEAGEDLSTYQYKLVKFNASGQVIHCNGAGDVPIGILQDTPAAAGDPASVLPLGPVVKVYCDGQSVNIAAGDPIGTSATSTGIKKTTDKDHVIGRACEACTTDGVPIRVLLTPCDIGV